MFDTVDLVGGVAGTAVAAPAGWRGATSAARHPVGGGRRAGPRPRRRDGRVKRGLAAEHAGVYDPALPPRRAGGAEGADPCQAADRDAGAHAPAPRSGEATKRLQRCATTPGSPLGEAMSRLAAAVDALADVAVADEHVDVAGDALVALHHLQSRLDARLLDLLGMFDRREGYAHDGAVTAGSWLGARTNIDFAAATTLVRAARRLHDLPRLAAHLAAGDLTLAHATAVTNAAVDQRAAAVIHAEPILADLALTSPPRDVRHALRRLAEIADPDGSDPDRHPDTPGPGHDPLRELTVRRGFQGRGELLATLDPLTREALTVLLDAFDTPDPPDTPLRQRRSPAQRRHDAFAAMLHTLTAQPRLPTVQGARPQVLITIDLAQLLGLPPDHPAAHTTLADIATLLGLDLTDPSLPHTTPTPADAAVADDSAPVLPDGDTAPAPADAAVDDTAPAAVGPPPPATSQPTASAGQGAWRAPDRKPRPARFGSGIAVDPATVRGLLPAATLMAVLTLGPWRAVNVGAKHRTLPAWLRSVLAAMHRHCRGPDCDRPANWTHAHHILDWALGHTTDLNDTLPLCPDHHDLITHHGWTAELDLTTGEVTWTAPHGRTIVVPPPRP